MVSLIIAPVVIACALIAMITGTLLIAEISVKITLFLLEWRWND